MVTEYEARQLQRDMRRELAGPEGAVWKCAVGILALVLVALLGTIPTDRGTEDLVKQSAETERRL